MLGASGRGDGYMYQVGPGVAGAFGLYAEVYSSGLLSSSIFHKISVDFIPLVLLLRVARR